MPSEESRRPCLAHVAAEQPLVGRAQIHHNECRDRVAEVGGDVDAGEPDAERQVVTQEDWDAPFIGFDLRGHSADLRYVRDHGLSPLGQRVGAGRRDGVTRADQGV